MQKRKKRDYTCSGRIVVLNVLKNFDKESLNIYEAEEYEEEVCIGAAFYLVLCFSTISKKYEVYRVYNSDDEYRVPFTLNKITRYVDCECIHLLSPSIIRTSKHQLDSKFKLQLLDQIEEVHQQYREAERSRIQILENHGNCNYNRMRLVPSEYVRFVHGGGCNP